ncbi:unnamed protein product [Cyclocybe aegerita]|uniref:Uncharacterized protein n=1 Tax=Cyclocybe aegerita TaxID=1973307 RepID=A0A8S0X7M5_CYCAE|nr:unnamed protein product [Cyclocybe aegerita]
MESVNNDPELASEMLGLMGKELKAARLRIKELESELEKSPTIAVHRYSEEVTDFKERTEAAEYSMIILRKHVDEVNAENTRLRLELDGLKDSKTWIKKEEQPAHEPPREATVSTDIQPSLGGISNEEKIKHLEEALEKYYAKYKAQKELKLELKVAIETLEDEKGCIQEDNLILQKKVAKAEDRIARLQNKTQEKAEKSKSQTLKEELRPEERLSSFSELSEFKKYMSALPRYSERPAPAQLRPICHEGVDLNAYLSADSRTASCAQSLLYSPGRMTWTSSDAHHALILGPIHVFDDLRKTWQKVSTLRHLYDQTFHVFFPRNNCILYGGLYKVHSFRDKHPDGCLLSGASGLSLAEATIVNASSVGHNPRSIKPSDIARLYMDGILKVEPVGLQCVGFDKELYGVLKRKFEVSLPVEKRKEVNPKTGPTPKKRKLEK